MSNCCRRGRRARCGKSSDDVRRSFGWAALDRAAHLLCFAAAVPASTRNHFAISFDTGIAGMPCWISPRCCARNALRSRRLSAGRGVRLRYPPLRHSPGRCTRPSSDQHAAFLSVDAQARSPQKPRAFLILQRRREIAVRGDHVRRLHTPRSHAAQGATAIHDAKSLTGPRPLGTLTLVAIKVGSLADCRRCRRLAQDRN